MNMDRVPFVHLRYAPRPFDAGCTTEIRLLILEDGPALEIVIRPDWRIGLGPEDQEYLSELMRDWRRATPPEIPILLGNLSELSIGPLQTVDTGLVDPEERNALMKKVCGTQPD
jgi:hypothetical protein